MNTNKVNPTGHIIIEVRNNFHAFKFHFKFINVSRIADTIDAYGKNKIYQPNIGSTFAYDIIPTNPIIISKK